MSLCPCNSNQRYSDCCEPIHQNHKNAVLPEQLMRARFSAHKLNLVDFVVATYHVSCKAEKERESIADSISLNWLRLEVLDAPEPDEKQGFVEFKAFMADSDGEHCMHERSRFVQDNGLWYYIDGEFPDSKPLVKVGRNDPCPCGNGKKFKKCCGR